MYWGKEKAGGVWGLIPPSKKQMICLHKRKMKKWKRKKKKEKRIRGYKWKENVIAGRRN